MQNCNCCTRRETLNIDRPAHGKNICLSLWGISSPCFIDTLRYPLFSQTFLDTENRFYFFRSLVQFTIHRKGRPIHPLFSTSSTPLFVQQSNHKSSIPPNYLQDWVLICSTYGHNWNTANLTFKQQSIFRYLKTKKLRSSSLIIVLWCDWRHLKDKNKTIYTKSNFKQIYFEVLWSLYSQAIINIWSSINLIKIHYIVPEHF
jgi:hypothetical protein